MSDKDLQIHHISPHDIFKMAYDTTDDLEDVLSDLSQEERDKLSNTCHKIINDLLVTKAPRCIVTSSQIHIDELIIIVYLGEVEEKLKDICRNPSKYYPNVGEKPLWDFLRYLYIFYPSGKSYRVIDVLDKIWLQNLYNTKIS